MAERDWVPHRRSITLEANKSTYSNGVNHGVGKQLLRLVHRQIEIVDHGERAREERRRVEPHAAHAHKFMSIIMIGKHKTNFKSCMNADSKQMQIQEYMR